MIGNTDTKAATETTTTEPYERHAINERIAFDMAVEQARTDFRAFLDAQAYDFITNNRKKGKTNND